MPLNNKCAKYLE